MTLKHAAFSASRWSTASTLVATGLQLLQTVILARILAPQDFGLMAVAMSVITMVSLLVDLGLSQALIHFDNVSCAERSSIYWLNMLLALVLMLAMWLAAPLLGMAYGSPFLVPLLHCTALIFPISAGGQQLRTLAAKELRFDLLAPIEVGATALSLICAVIAALLGAGVYALAVGFLVRAGAGSVLAWVRLPRAYRPTLHFNPREAMPFLGFGGYLVGESVAGAATRSADVFAGGLVLGPSALGIYALPRDLNLQLSALLNRVVTNVGFPVMSKVKAEPDRVRHIYMQTLRMTASINFPLYICVGLFANEIINLLYGPRWHEAALYLRILAVWGLIRSTGNPVGSLVYATGQTKRAFWWAIGALITLAPLYWLATHIHGTLGLAGSLLLLQAMLVIPAWYFLVKPCCGATLREYLSQFGAPLLCALAAGMLAWLAAHDLPHGVLRLAVGCIVGGIAYLGLSLALNRRWVDAVQELLRLPSHGNS